MRQPLYCGATRQLAIKCSAPRDLGFFFFFFRRAASPWPLLNSLFFFTLQLLNEDDYRYLAEVNSEYQAYLDNLDSKVKVRDGLRFNVLNVARFGNQYMQDNKVWRWEFWGEGEWGGAIRS